jgi:TonB family protein
LASEPYSDDNTISGYRAWEGITVDDAFPLLRFIGAGDHSAVFETEYRDGGTQRAAIKFVPASHPDASAILENWQAASALSHPSLLQILAGGESSIGDDAYIYVVTELADDSLANVLQERRLSAQETREMLGPMVSALRYLHGKGFVHGHLRPSNTMAVGDQLKIPAENAVKCGDTSTDIQDLGKLLLRVLDEPVPEPFREIVNGCLDRNPSTRWTLNRIEDRLTKGTGAAARAAAAAADQSETKRDINPALWIGGGGGALLVILVLVLWLGGDSFRMENLSTPEKPATEAPAASSAADESKQGAPQASAKKDASPKGQAKKEDSRAADKSSSRDDASAADFGRPVPPSSIAKRVLPDIPRQGRDTINGRVTINVKVDVDAAGNVTNATSLSPKVSKFFTKYALDAAREWKFTPKEQPHALVIKFLLRRTETEVSVVEAVN